MLRPYGSATTEQVLLFAERQGRVTARQVADAGIPRVFDATHARSIMDHLAKQGRMKRVEPGTYDFVSHRTNAQIAQDRRIP